MKFAPRGRRLLVIDLINALSQFYPHTSIFSLR
jgi:hypothetical protein